jgi:diguanylate cyclase (GGDEF)-like protein
VLAELLRQYPGYVNLGVVGPDGVLLCTARGSGEGVTLGDRRYVRVALDTRQPGPAEYHVDPASGRPVVGFAAPVSDGAALAGAVVALVDPAWLSQAVGEIPLSDQATITVVDGSGIVVARTPEGRRWVGTTLPAGSAVRTLLSRGQGTVEDASLDGASRFYAAAPVGESLGTELALAVGLSRAAGLGAANQRLAGHLVALGVVATLALGAAWIGGRRLAAATTVAEAEQRARQALVEQVGELVGQRAREVALLNQMGGLLEACLTVEEAAAVIGRLAPQFFPGARGAVFLLEPTRRVAERVAVWGTPGLGGPPTFPPDGCWALRRGQLHAVADTAVAPSCLHLAEPAPVSSLCVPLVAQGESLGILHLAGPPGGIGGPTGPAEERPRLAVSVAEHLALAVANLRLRESLRAQSIRDPLTGLFNRRYMEETLERELRRAERERHPVGILILDVDHFKRFNDTHGHDGGDAVLAGLGGFLLANVRGGDVACRHGGEEFVLILPGASTSESRRRAIELLAATRGLQVAHRGQLLGPVTFSVGVAAYPDHGTTREALLRAADAAVYRAKHEGRNQIAVAG